MEIPLTTLDGESIVKVVGEIMKIFDSQDPKLNIGEMYLTISLCSAFLLCKMAERMALDNVAGTLDDAVNRIEKVMDNGKRKK